MRTTVPAFVGGDCLFPMMLFAAPYMESPNGLPGAGHTGSPMSADSGSAPNSRTAAVLETAKMRSFGTVAVSLVVTYRSGPNWLPAGANPNPPAPSTVANGVIE